MAMSYYTTNYPMYAYPAFSGHYDLYANGVSDLSRNAQLARSALTNHTNMTKSTESKPRLAKEEVEQLEAEFQKNSKPNTSLKKALAEQMRVDAARINNWFQNRRAKAKHEARQKQEKVNSEATSPRRDEANELFPSTDHQDDLHPSSATFPAPDSPPSEPLAPPPMSQAEDLPPVIKTETVPEMRSEYLPLEFTSPESVPFHGAEHTFPLPVAESTFFPSHPPTGFQTMIAPTTEVGDHVRHASLPLSLSTSMATSLEGSTDGLNSFAPFGDMVQRDGNDMTLASFPSQLLHRNSAVLDGKTNDPPVSERYGEITFQQVTPESFSRSSSIASPDSQFKAPPAVDLASRRNGRRPAPLGANALRTVSYSHNGPRTGIELPRRPEVPSPMRRIASATGVGMPGRITKPISATPKSPLYLVREPDVFFQLARSPVMRGPLNSIAPPTPDTPMVLNQQGIREATVSSTSSEDDKGGYSFQSAAFSMDPTMRTPPATPSLLSNFSEAVFSNPIEASYNFSVPDEPLATPIMATFGTETDFPLQARVPSYIANTCTSQPPTPSIAPTPIGPAYFAIYPGSNMEYNWSDTPSTKSSPRQQQPKPRQFQFSNSTPQDYNNPR